jgi:hypothetical protein
MCREMIIPGAPRVAAAVIGGGGGGTGHVLVLELVVLELVVLEAVGNALGVENMTVCFIR